MSNYINTITIEPQESASALAEACAAALGEALGWTVDGASVWQDEDKNGLRVIFSVVNTTVYFYPGNSNVSSTSINTCAWVSGRYYCIDYIKTESAVAVGWRSYGDEIVLSGIIAQNTDNKWRAIIPYYGNYYSAESPSFVNIPYSTYRNVGAAVSLVKYPDVWGGCMFKNLYFVMSRPMTATDVVYMIDGIYYRHIGLSTNGAFAIPVG